VSSRRGLRIIGPIESLIPSSDSILISFLLCFKLEHFIIYAFLCNSIIHVITFYLNHVCVILCVNTSMLTPRMNYDYD
jgi:hypothetical protein